LRDREKMRERADLERQRDAETRERRGREERERKRQRENEKKKTERKRSNLAPEIYNKKNRCVNSVTLQIVLHCSPMRCQSILAFRCIFRWMVRLGVEYEYYSNTLCELRGLTL
jgi:hypothetical protein